MGNCIQVLCNQPAEKSRVIIYNGEEKEFKAFTKVKKITSGCYNGCKIVHHAFPFSPLPPNTKLEPRELYYLMPPLVKTCSSLQVLLKLANQEIFTKQKVKIVLTRRQLESLLNNAKEFKSAGVSVQCLGSFKDGDQKWQPSLTTIQEQIIT
ncbi:conserved hypothetical protein [Ricinus communis]|uniref:Uncharacterized protein n=1 Tax=Ricinus communis TaxID=3988 RepID=B9SA67_RICCO|nr:conserved hypothetical protein [Ricinus communis]